MADPLVTTTPRVETTEVLTADGNSIAASASLGSIFDKIEAGLPAAEAIEEVMSGKTPEVKTPEVKEPEVKEPEVKVEEKKEEEPTTLAEAFKAKEEANAADAAAKVEEKAAEQKEADPEAVTAEELQVLPHDRPKTAKRIAALLKKVQEADAVVATTKKEVEAKQARLSELETELTKTKSADPSTNDAIKSQLEELAMYRRQYELDKDPEVKTKFDSRIESAEKSVGEILTKFGAGEALLAIVKEEGGWAKFCDSQRTIPMSDGRKLPASEVAEMIVESLPYGSKRAIEAATIEQTQTTRDRQRFYEEQKKTAVDYFKSREEGYTKQLQTQQEAAKVAQSEVDNWKKDILEKTEWIKDKPIPSSATPEQKAQIEAENKTAQELKAKVEKAVNAQGLTNVLSVMKDAVTAYHAQIELTRKESVIKAQEARIKELEAQVDKVKSAGRSVPRQGSIAPGANASSTPAKPQIPQSLEEAFAVIESGGKLGLE